MKSLSPLCTALLFCGLSCAAGEGMTVRRGKDDAKLEILDAGEKVLQYNFRTVPVPDGVKGKYAVARGDYIHPLYGPGGEVLTKDFSPDHPHHRGLYWAWPEVYYKGKRYDLHALQGVFARPDRIVSAEGGAESARIVAASKWMWEDTEPIVAEKATIVARKKDSDGGRVIDLAFEFRALVEGVSIARRGQKNYGGFNMRCSARKGRKIIPHVDPAGSRPRRAWAQITGTPPGAKGPVTIAIIQHAANPHYPGDWVSYPKIDWLQPTFPSKGVKYELKKGEPLVLKFRVYVAPGTASDQKLAELWKEFNAGDAK